MPAIYVHMPFCKQKCKYCDFASYPGLDSLHKAYVDALITEIASQASKLDELQAGSIYIGGGTPTLLDPLYIDMILSAIREHFVVSNDAEITIEANPETVSEERLSALIKSGVNRLSVGFQSLDDDLLVLLGRKHSAAQAIDAFMAARRAGFENINIDLIFGIPNQSLAHWALTLEQAVSLGPEHLSCYGLTVEPNTPLEHEIAKGDVGMPDEDVQADMFAYTVESLADSGYEHYEISNYAQQGSRCRHNLVYWNNDDYIGFGSGAHSKIGDKRFSSTVKPGEYIKNMETGCFKPEIVNLSKEDRMSETIFLGLRKMDGVHLDDFKTRYGVSIHDVYGIQINSLVKDGLIECRNDSVKLTGRGILLGNEVFSRFI